MPFGGSIFKPTIMFARACTPITVAMPIARYFPNGSRARRPIRKPTQTRVMKQAPTATTPAKPSSSPMTEKM